MENSCRLDELLLASANACAQLTFKDVIRLKPAETSAIAKFLKNKCKTVRHVEKVLNTTYLLRDLTDDSLLTRVKFIALPAGVFRAVHWVR
jgi:hypothetical protein